VETKVVKIDAANIDESAIKEASQIVDAGGLVAFPTETVYGIACRAETESLAKLDMLKGRPAEKCYTLHIGRPDVCFRYVPAMGLRARKLVKNAWPGPLTVVFELERNDLEQQKAKLSQDIFSNLYRDSSIGIRCPDNPIASMLLSQTTRPVVAPSANLSGQEPAIEAGQVIEQFAGKLEMIIAGGICKYGKSSTIVKVTKAGIEILRQGVYPEPQVLEMAKVTILFVCTGNSCRSPMAEGLFMKYLAEKLGIDIDHLEENGYIVTSAGTLGIVGFPASAAAVRSCAEKGVDISGHRTRALTAYLLEQSDVIYVMAQGHFNAVEDFNPDAAERCLLLSENGEIADPIGQSQEIYDACVELIEEAVKKRVSELKL
jgi:tRNA threonylcarbamoyl adenosine modification protein (Sua5/YciO/YrdC/YwlC family)